MMHRRHNLLLATTALTLLASPLVAGPPTPPPATLPQGPSVQAGSATISTQGSTLTINQSTNSAIINWNTFNIGSGGTVRINMPSSNSVELDRVTGGLGPSQVFGTLSSNGTVFLVNPNGIMFGQGAVVNVGGLLATTHDIKNSDFMAGRYNFSIPGNPSASVVNQGNITAASGGFAALVAPGVRNTGTITATLGTVGLASSGNGFTLDFYGDKLITLAVGDNVAKQVVDVSTGQALSSLVSNSGKVSANGGRVEITAAAAKTIVNSVINNTGVIEANSIGTKNGMIVLGAATGKSKPAGAPAQNVKLAGTISAAGKDKGTKGGTVQVTGENISLTGAKIDASGQAGGGTVLIGGDVGGGAGNAAVAGIPQAALQPWAVPTATTVTIDSASMINASAIASGNGGKVVVWSDQATSFAGLIKATGGAGGGNGGFVETSSHGVLSFTGLVDVSAPAGKAGTLLLDPMNLWITASGSAPDADPTASAISVGTVQTELANGNVVLTTAATGSQQGNLTVANGITWSGGNSLTLSAYNNVVVNASITNTSGGAAITLRADNTGTGNGTVIFNDGGSVSTSGQVSVFYNPSVNPAGSVVNATSYVNPTENYYNSGEGPVTAYMLVNTVNDLQNVQNNLGGTYALGRNIDAGKSVNWNGGSGFVPIGNDGSNFTGIFNGQGNTISNLFINQPGNSGVGLFGYIGDNGSIQNVGLLGGSVTGGWSVGALVGSNAGTVTQSYATTAVNGSSAVGGLVGNNSGLVAKSYATGQVSGTGGDDVGGLVGYNSGTVTRSYATGAVSGPLDVGGLVGDNSYGTVTMSYATGAVTGTNTYFDYGVGGLVGYMYGGSIAQSYATGAVNGVSYVGGLVGWSAGTITQSYATGAVTASNNVGGLVGYNNGSITQAYSSGAVTGGTGGSNVGALVGWNDATGVVSSSYWDSTINPVIGGFGTNTNIGSFGALGLTTGQFATANNFSGWGFGSQAGGKSCSDGPCWVIVDADGTLNNGIEGGSAGATRPMLLSEWSRTITNAHQLELMALDLSAHYKLATNINLGAALSNPSDVWGPNGAAGFVPIGSDSGFSGRFNGKGYTIDGLSIASDAYSVGLFSYINPGAAVKNLNLTNVSVAGTGSGQQVGALAGENDGRVSNVTVTGGLNGGVSGGGDQATIGGLIGYNTGSIRNSLADVTVTATIGNGPFGIASFGGLVGLNDSNGRIVNSGAYGNVDGGAFANMVGGLVGQNLGVIGTSWAAGNVTGAGFRSTSDECTKCSQTAYLGGLVGVNGSIGEGSNGTISNSLATGAVTGGNYSAAGGLVGFNPGNVSLSYATGNVTGSVYAGGLVGYNSGDIYQTYASGSVAGTDGTSVGGLVGFNSRGSIGSSFWDTTIGPSLGVGNAADGFAGVTGIGTTAFANVSTFTDAGWRFGTTAGGRSCGDGACWVIVDADGGLNNQGGAANGVTRPMLLSEWSPTIANAHQLQLMALDPTANYRLANPIDLGKALANPSDVWGPSIAKGFSTIVNEVVTGSFVPVGTNGNWFTGIFNGGGNTISGLNIALTDPYLQSIGLFGVIGQYGVVKDLTLTGVNITINADLPTANVQGQFVGGLAGQNAGLIKDVTVSGTINGMPGGNSIDGVLAGGLVGQNGTFGPGDTQTAGTIKRSQADVNITLGNGNNCNGSDCVGGFNYAGGLAGMNPGIISRSSASGTIIVGSNADAGGLVGNNGNYDQATNASIPGAIIYRSYATGTVSSAALNVNLGGLVGQNASFAIIANSRASGAVTSTAAVTKSNSNCSDGGNCQYVEVGGLVGQNSGTISGKAWDNVPTTCGSGFTCASGAVAVGSEGFGGGLVGNNSGIIINAFVVNANVTGAAGLPGTTGHQFDNQTSLGGFVGSNEGTITNSFVTGSVGQTGVPNLQVGGFVANNSGTISNSFANVTVVAGNNSVAGGFAANNSGNTCGNCPGDGYSNYATITNATAHGDVTVGDSSVVGGFTGYVQGTLSQVSAYGAVNSGANSTAGGLVGVLDVNGQISGSTAQNTLVASTGPNSTVGGLVGANGGNVTTSSSYGPVTGGADSYIGGLIGANFGTVTSSTVDPTISGTGANDVIGGLVGLNVGSITGTTGVVALVSTGTGNLVGGIAGVNGTYNFTGPNPFTPGATSQTGSFDPSTTSVTGSGFTSLVGTTTPPSPPAFPSWVPNCNASVCNGINDGSLSTSAGGNTNNGNTVTDPGNYGTQQISTFTVPPNPNGNNFNFTPITLGPTGGTGGNGGNGGGGGNGATGSLGNGGNGAPPGTRLIDMPVIPLPPGSGLPPPGETRFLSNEVVFQIGNGVSLQQVQDIARQFGLTIVSSDPLGILGRTVYTFRITDGRSVRDVIRAIEAAKLAAWAGPVYTYGLTQDPVSTNPASTAPGAASAPASLPANPDAEIGDPAQYVIEKFQFAEIHRLTRGDNVVVAVIDSEIDARHPDLAGVVTGRYDAGCGTTPPDAHGTGMTGAIASRKNLLGVAPNVRIIAICAFGGEAAGESTSIKIIKGIDYAISQGARIINMSFAGPRDPGLAQALQIAREKGVVLIGAAGNAGPKSPPLYPGADPNVIAVTATDDRDRLFRGANQGKYIAVAAPGVDILVPAPDGGVQLTTGTSVATAEVSGVAALLIAQQPSRTPEDIRNILMSTAKDLGPKGVDSQFGAGLVDPLKALRLAPARVSDKSAALRAPLLAR